MDKRNGGREKGTGEREEEGSGEFADDSLIVLNTSWQFHVLSSLQPKPGSATELPL